MGTTFGAQVRGVQGRVFGDFVLKERLGAGGGGEVYLASQVTLAREAVVKVMTVSDQREAAERFLREARLASQLDHPFAAHIYGFGNEADGVLWIAMELVRGVSLEAMVREHGSVPLARFVPFFERLCEVIHAAHEQGIVHRDIKPANVMVINRAGRLLPKLLDLGIARRGTDQGAAASAASDDEDDDVGTGDGADQLLFTNSSSSITLAGRLTQSETMNLTRVGALVGTPHYMAPEQWVDASSAGPRADLYSLSLLAYRVMTGRVAFEGKSLRALARAHASMALPPLPDTLPSALYEVLSRGAAKDPNQRFATAIELGAALRAASGIGSEPLALPQLDEGLRENLISEAPQPLAESVALLESARSPTQQLEAVVMVRKLVIRHLALLALAARARVGPGRAEDSALIKAHLRALATGALGDAEWLSLARELCQPFAFRKAAHPVPELVTFFYAGDSDLVRGSGAEALSSLDALGLPERGAPDEAVHAALLRLMPALGRVLQNLSFIYDYPLIVQQAHAERWMGTRRSRRLTQTVVGAPAQGVPVLVDSVGLPVLSLAPLLQVFTPGGALPEELFYLEGAGRHGARLTSLPGQFERQSDEVWPWFSANIFDVSDAQGAVAATEAVPYKGLSTFTREDADNYFGRELEAQTFANRLRSLSLLAVVGPSGSGKSSFVLAGVLPLLPKSWRAVVARPGATPFDALAGRLGLDVERLTVSDVTQTLAESETLVVVIDQFEELVTLCPDADARQAFASLLVTLAEQSNGRVRVVLTLRDDFLIKIQQLQALRERLSSALQLLGTPARDDLLRVVSQPAARVGYGFDDQTLPQRMVDEVAEYPGALALLSFAASQLWELRDRHLRQMRAKTYEALGGVGGALAHHAEMTLAQMSEVEAKLAREAFRHLVTSQSTRAVLSRVEMVEVLGDSPSAHSVLEKLVTARLLVSSEDLSGEDRVEIIHEALIVSWPRLVGWLREDAETARLRDSLRASAKQWAERGKASGLLWRKETLAEYRVWRLRFTGRLTQLEEAFASASLREESRARTLRRVLAIAAFVVLAVGLAVVFRAYRLADASAIEAKQRLLTLRQEQGRLALLALKPLEAQAYLEAGRPEQVTPAFAHLEWYASWLTRGRLSVFHAAAPLKAIAVSPDQKKVAAFSLNGEGLELDFGTRQTRPVPQGLGVYADNEHLWVTARESFILDVSATGRERLETGHLIWSLHPSTPGHLGARMAPPSAATSSTIAVVFENAQPLKVLEVSPPVTTLASLWAPDQQWVATYAGNGSVEAHTYRGLSLFNARTKKVAGRYFTDDVIRSVTFLKGGDLLLGGASGALRRVSTDGALRWKTDLSLTIDDFELNPGQTLAAARARGSVVFVDPASGRLVRNVSLSSDSLASGRWSDDHFYLAGQLRGEVAKVNADTGETWWTFVGPTQATADAVAFRDGARLAVASNDTTLTLFDNSVAPAEELLTNVLGVWSTPEQPTVIYATAEGLFDLQSRQSVIDGVRPDGEAVAGAVRGDRVALSDAHAVFVGDAKSRALLARVAIETAAYELWFDQTGANVGVCLLDGRTAVVDVAKATLRYLPPHKTQCNRGEFSRDGKHLVMGADVGPILVYRFPELVLEREFEGHNGGTFMHEGPPGQWLALGWDGAISLWDQDTLEQVSRIDGITGNNKYILNASLHDGLLSLYMGSGEWITYDWASNLMLSKYRMPFTFKGLALPSGTNDAIGLTEEGKLLRLPLNFGQVSTQCESPYVIAGDKLLVNKLRLSCPAQFGD